MAFALADEGSPGGKGLVARLEPEGEHAIAADAPSTPRTKARNQKRAGRDVTRILSVAVPLRRSCLRQLGRGHPSPEDCESQGNGTFVEAIVSARDAPACEAVIGSTVTESICLSAPYVDETEEELVLEVIRSGRKCPLELLDHRPERETHPARSPRASYTGAVRPCRSTTAATYGAPTRSGTRL